MTGLALSQARAASVLRIAGGLSDRVAARALPVEAREMLYDEAFAGALLVDVDPEVKSQVLVHAAAVLCGNDLAAAISAADRAEIGRVIDEKTRLFALAHRQASRSASGKAGAEVLDVVKATIKECDGAWGDMLPRAKVERLADPRALAALELAVEHVRGAQ